MDADCFIPALLPALKVYQPPVLYSYNASTRIKLKTQPWKGKLGKARLPKESD
jgi:hypothetical protein